MSSSFGSASFSISKRGAASVYLGHSNAPSPFGLSVAANRMR